MCQRIRELFYLEARMPKEIVEMLVKENPSLKEDDLKKLTNDSLRDDILSGYPDGNGNRYLRRPNGLYKISGFGESLKPTLLTNFKVDSLTTIVTDDGQSQSEAVRVEYQVSNGCKHEVTLSADELRQMNWYIGGCDQRAIITPREKEYALQAIQLTALRKAKETIRPSTGWYVIDGKAYFLHANGAISSEGQTQHSEASSGRLCQKSSNV